MILIGARTGLRLGELVALRWADVDFAAKRILVRRSIVRGVESSTKSNRERAVDLSTSALSALRAHRHNASEFVFCDDAGQHLTRGMLHDAIERAGKKAEIGQVGWHVLRHTFASHLAIAGVSLRAIQLLMGHSTIAMTERYAHLSQESIASAVARLP